LRKIKTASSAAKITAQTINIPREEGGGRFGSWITGENTTVRDRQKFKVSGHSSQFTGQKEALMSNL
jgi:hypothetical protein